MISPLAQIHPNAEIGNNVTIDPFVVIEDKVKIGDGTRIMPNAFIGAGTTIGANCTIFPSAVIGTVPQDLKFVGEETTVVIGDNTTVREFCTIHRGTKDKFTTMVGNRCLLMAYSHVAHDCLLGNNVILANSVQLAGHVIVDDFAIIGGLSGAHQFSHIGAHSYIAGQSSIRKDIPPFVKAAREPMSYMGVNVVGLTRSGFSAEEIEEISSIYHILFVEKNTTTKAMEVIESNFAPGKSRDAILNFIRNSKTGIIKRNSKYSEDENFSV